MPPPNDDRLGEDGGWLGGGHEARVGFPRPILRSGEGGLGRTERLVRQTPPLWSVAQRVDVRREIQVAFFQQHVVAQREPHDRMSPDDR